MLSLLETLLTLVGVVLILALAVQSLQEIVKVVFPIKAFTRQQNLESLVIEASVAAGLNQSDGAAIYDQVVGHLRGLGQKGVRRSAVRLDSLDPDALAKLVAGSEWHKIPALKPQDEAEAKKSLQKVASTVKDWFPLAMAPVDSRNTRRMRATTLIASALLVIGLNVDGLGLLQRARTDAVFRASVQKAVADLQPPAKINGGQVDEAQAAQAAQDALDKLLADDAGLFDIAGPREWGNPEWWAGIVLMVFLVSLGAPFWHDLLGALMGVRKRVQAEAKRGGRGGEGGT